MRRIWRLIRFSFVIVWRTFLLDLKLRGVDEKDRALFRAKKQQAACAKLCRVLGVEVRVKGKVQSEGTMLAISNHLGLLDTLVLASQVPVVFAAKAEIVNWPVIGWICRVVGVIFVKRERRMQTGIFVEEVQSRLRQGVRVLVFPEGTTGNGVSLLPFKTGAFAAVAGMEDAAVLPLYLKGISVDDNPAEGEHLKHLIWSHGVPMLDHARGLLDRRKIVIEVRIGEPIATANRDRKELSRLSYDAVTALGE